MLTPIERAKLEIDFQRQNENDDDQSCATTNSCNSLISRQSSTTEFESLLSVETLKWLNKRRPKGSNIPGYIMPSLAFQMAEIFGSDSRDFQELKQAVKRVNSSYKYNKHVRKEVLPHEEVINFFSKMDHHCSGSVDFIEFIASVSSSSDLEDSRAREARLKLQFYEFTNQLRRRNIIEQLETTAMSDLEKCKELAKLFSIEYFVPDKPIIINEVDPAKHHLKSIKEPTPHQTFPVSDGLRGRRKKAHHNLAELQSYPRRLSRLPSDSSLPSLHSMSLVSSISPARGLERGLEKLHSHSYSHLTPQTFQTSSEVAAAASTLLALPAVVLSPSEAHRHNRKGKKRQFMSPVRVRTNVDDGI